MRREEELEEIKKEIEENIEDARCGIFNTPNIVGDFMEELYKGEFFELDICYEYGYYELFGTTEEEFKEIKKYYNEIKRE